MIFPHSLELLHIGCGLGGVPYAVLLVRQVHGAQRDAVAAGGHPRSAQGEPPLWRGVFRKVHHTSDANAQLGCLHTSSVSASRVREQEARSSTSAHLSNSVVTDVTRSMIAFRSSMRVPFSANCRRHSSAGVSCRRSWQHFQQCIRTCEQLLGVDRLHLSCRTSSRCVKICHGRTFMLALSSHMITTS